MKIKLLAALSATVAISVGITLIILLQNKSVDGQKDNVKEIALSKAYSLQRQIDLSVSSALALATYVQKHKAIENFDSVAAEIRKVYKVISILELAHNGIIGKLSPLRGYENTLGVNLLVMMCRGERFMNF